MKLVSRLPLNDAIDAWGFIIENLVSLYANTGQAEAILRPLLDAVMINTELTLRIATVPALENQKDALAHFQEFYTGKTLIPIGSRQKAIDEIEQWCLEFAADYLLVVDPTFRQDDLSLIELLRKHTSGCKFVIISSKGIQSPHYGSSSVEESYKKHWRELTATDDLGNVEVILVGAGMTGELPVSHRAILAKKSGILMEVSFSQLGLSSDSTIQRLSSEESALIEMEIEPYFGTLHYKSKQQLSISRFTLH
jgi:hypothetical protein